MGWVGTALSQTPPHAPLIPNVKRPLTLHIIHTHIYTYITGPSSSRARRGGPWRLMPSSSPPVRFVLLRLGDRCLRVLGERDGCMQSERGGVNPNQSQAGAGGGMPFFACPYTDTHIPHHTTSHNPSNRRAGQAPEPPLGVRLLVQGRHSLRHLRRRRAHLPVRFLGAAVWTVGFCVAFVY